MKTKKIYLLISGLAIFIVANLLFFFQGDVIFNSFVQEAEMAGECIAGPQVMPNHQYGYTAICYYDDDCNQPHEVDGIDSYASRCLPGGTSTCYDTYCSPYCIRVDKWCIPDFYDGL